MPLPASPQPGDQLHDRILRQSRLVESARIGHGHITLTFKDPPTGAISQETYAVADFEQRFERLDPATTAFRGDPELVKWVAEAYRLQHAYLFNPLFATETSLIDLLPHQLAAVYGTPASDATPAQPGMLDHPRLRFLLADDAGAGKTIMAGLLIREFLSRRQAERILVVPPAGLIRNWQRELATLFRLRFQVVASSDVTADRNPFTDPVFNLALISLDTLWQDKVLAAYTAAPPYDLVIFDEAHKLSARQLSDLTVEATNRYAAAEFIARQNRHLLLMTATPHMGKDDAYYLLWRLLEPDLLASRAAFDQLTGAQKRSYLLRRMKEEMVDFDGKPIYTPRLSQTVDYPLRPGADQEQGLYDQVTEYCNTQFDRAGRHNRGAARLAMSILQRRLASSSWAIWQSLNRRTDKLQAIIDAVRAGRLDEAGLLQQQSQMATDYARDAKTGDEEEAVDGQEEADAQEEVLLGATAARTLFELETERAEVKRLTDLARKVYDQRNESKFERIWETLTAYPQAKILIFTEFRDTLDFLVDRLGGKGLTGQIAAIHGGMPYDEREQQVDFFRQQARLMVATDAAGEGINLQFCWLLVNYDIPWNPARLEQRMGRVHRYGQQHSVLLFNLVSTTTREGRVLTVLLDKLATIRHNLGRDKVFDIIGQQFSRRSLPDLIQAATLPEQEAAVLAELAALDDDNARAILARQARQVEVRDVRLQLTALQAQQASAEAQRMMPAYMRRFFQQAAHSLNIAIAGDIQHTFSLPQPPPTVEQALRYYPADIRAALTFERALAKPGLDRRPRALYLHPGEPVFEALRDLFLGGYAPLGWQGALFYDPDATEAYLFYLGRIALWRDPPAGGAPDRLDQHMTGIRRTADGRCVAMPAHTLLTLFPRRPSDPWPAATSLQQLGGDLAPAENFLSAEIGLTALNAWRQGENARLPERRDRLRRAFNLRQVELLRQRRLLGEEAAQGLPAAQTRLRDCEAESDRLPTRRQAAEAELLSAPDRLRLGPPQIVAQALVLPLPVEQAAARADVDAERIALAEVRAYELAQGSRLEDVSAPYLKAGFDLKITRPDGAQRYIEVKGRRGQRAVELTENEWTQAANHRDRYWLYVVFNCDTLPSLHRVPDPFGRLVAGQTGSVIIQARAIVAAAQVSDDARHA